MKASLTKAVLGLALLLGIVPAAYAQTGTITGTVTDAQDGITLPGANVVIVQSGTGTATDVDGRYTFEDVPVGTYTLRVTFVGYRQTDAEVTVTEDETITQDFELRPDLQNLDEVVVTGVASGTSTKKLGFAVGKVGEERLQAVPAVDPGNALRGKVAGVTIVQASGDPTNAPDIRLRGSTSISGDNSPLIIVDGVITEGNLNDINMQDVESIEVVKGAAASSLYGSLASNGVIQIRTKRGSSTGGLSVRVRSEFGFSQIARDFPLADRHPFKLDQVDVLLPDGETTTLQNPTEEDLNNLPSGARLQDWTGRRTEDFDGDGLFDNAFPINNDNIDAVATGQAFNTNYIAISNTGEDYSYLASFENFSQGGAVEAVDSSTRNSFRLNADYRPTDDFELNFSGSYVLTEAPLIEEQGQGDNFFYSVLVAEPYIDLTETNDDGQFSNDPTGYDVQASNFQNPLYVAEQRDFVQERDRIIAGATASYEILDGLSANARQSIDRSYIDINQFFPVGYITPTPSPTLNDGFNLRRSRTITTLVTQAWLQYDGDLGEDFGYSATAQYLYEQREDDFHEGEGSRFNSRGVRDQEALDQSTVTINSFLSEERTENYFLTLDVDYQDKIIASGLVRRDGSSLFGSEERWQTFYRGSLAYRISEDFDIPRMQELKVRASFGTSGLRPPFRAQFETYDVGTTGISPDALGNRFLKPSRQQELEVGVNAAFLDRFTMEVNYARSQVFDDYIEVPLSSAAGFSSQFQNVGEIESTAFEVAVGAAALSTRNTSLRFDVTFDRVRQEITDLGGVPPFTRNLGSGLDDADPALPLFRVEEGLPYGTMYGNVFASSLDDLTVVDGEVINSNGIDIDGDGAITVDDFEVNDQGFVVPRGTRGTSAELPTLIVNERGEAVTQIIGDTQPDFQMGLSTSFQYKGFGFYALADWSQGGEVYNYTKQLLYFNNRHEDQQDFAAQGIHRDFAFNGVYNNGNAADFFVEDASFVKLREVSLSYTIDRDLLSRVFSGQYVESVRLSVIGRNLFTLTDYSGWDPEVALATNSTNFRLDEFAYPNFRTFTGAIQLQF